jgi:hypothetical protein
MKGKKEGPGAAFETAFQASLPTGVHVRRLRTPTAMGFVVPQLVKLVGEQSALLHRPVPEWVQRAARFRFTPKSGVDFLLTAPAPADPIQVELRDALGGPVQMAVQPVIHFSLELKSVDGSSLPFDNTDKHQEKALRESAAAGHVAGFLIEFRGPGEVWFVPVAAWDAVRLVTDRKSLPVATARVIGMEVLPDPYRGETRPYWDLAAWIVQCGALLPEKPPKGERKHKQAAPQAPPFTEDPEAPAVPVPLSLFDWRRGGGEER